MPKVFNRLKKSISERVTRQRCKTFRLLENLVQVSFRTAFQWVDYAVRSRDSERASYVRPTQAEAIERTRELNPGKAPLVERTRYTSEGRPDKWHKP